MADILSEAAQIAAHAEMLAREKACYLYTAALDRGDFDTVAAILCQAEGDAELDRMIIEIDAALYEEMERQFCAVCGGPVLPLPGSFCPVCNRRKGER